MDIPLLPDFLAKLAFDSLQVIHELNEQDEDLDVPLFPFEMIASCYEQLQQLFDVYCAEGILLYEIFKVLFPHGRNAYEEVYTRLAMNPTTFWLMTGETIDSFLELCQRPELNLQVEQQATCRDQLLMTLIYLRQYPTIRDLSNFFAIDPTVTWTIIRNEMQFGFFN